MGYLDRFTSDISSAQMYWSKSTELAEKIWLSFLGMNAEAEAKNQDDAVLGEKKFSNALSNIFNKRYFLVLSREDVKAEIAKFTQKEEEQHFLNLLFDFFLTFNEDLEYGDGVCMNDPSEVYKFFYCLKYSEREIFKVLCLDGNFFLKKSINLAIGSENRVILNPMDIFFFARKTKSKHLILVHNHPSGSVEPSVEDLYFTREMQKICQKIGLEFIDHIIISDGYYSFRKDGFLQLRPDDQ